MSDAFDDSHGDSPGARFWRLLGRSGQADSNIRRQQQLLTWREAIAAILVARRSEGDLMQRFCDSVLHNQVASFAAILLLSRWPWRARALFWRGCAARSMRIGPRARAR